MITLDERQHEKAASFVALHMAPGVFVIPNPWDINATSDNNALELRAAIQVHKS